MTELFDLRRLLRVRLHPFYMGLGLVACSLPLLLSMASVAAFQNQLATWEGRVQKVNRDGLLATLDTGEASIRLSKGAQGLRNGFTTSILVTGSDRVSVLKTGLHVRFECELDEQGELAGTILKIEARDQPFAEKGIFPAASQEVPPPDAASETPQSPPAARFEIVGELRKVDLGRRTIEVWYPKENMPATRLGPFPIDPEATRVDFAFLELTHARPSDQLFVRGFLSEDDSSIVAAEIRISRNDVFPPDEVEGVRLDPLAAPPELGMAETTTDAENSETADMDPAVAIAGDEPVEPGETAPEDSLIPPGLAANTEAEVFEFPKNAPPKTAEEKARRHYKIN